MSKQPSVKKDESLQAPFARSIDRDGIVPTHQEGVTKECRHQTSAYPFGVPEGVPFESPGLN